MACRRALVCAMLRAAVGQGWAAVGTTVFKLDTSSGGSSGGGLNPIPCCSISVSASMDNVQILWVSRLLLLLLLLLLLTVLLLFQHHVGTHRRCCCYRRSPLSRPL
jgi:hypothetical protein